VHNALNNVAFVSGIGGTCSTNWSVTNACTVLAASREGKRPVGRSGRRGKDNIRMDLRNRV